jgi:phage shock protein PspC (stress-responsive transcriptional regulator)
MFGFWCVVVAAGLAPIFGRDVLYVTVLSVIALIPNFSSETPVEEE